MIEEDELLELHSLNIQLMEILVVVAHRFLEYKKNYGIDVEGMERLSALCGRAESLLRQISTPYRGNPINPVEERPPRDKLTPYPIGGYEQFRIWAQRAGLGTLRVNQARKGPKWRDGAPPCT